MSASVEEKLEVVNKKPVSDLLEVEASEEDYALAVDIVSDYIQDLYKEYRFNLMKPQMGDFTSGYSLVFTIDPRTERGQYISETLFKLAIDRGLYERTISNTFAEKVSAGEVLPIGDVIVDEETTGFSSILTGEPVQVFISYEPEDYKEKRLEIEEEQKKQQEEYEERLEKQREIKYESHKALVEASKILKVMTEELVEEHPEYVEAYNEVQELFNG